VWFRRGVGGAGEGLPGTRTGRAPLSRGSAIAFNNRGHCWHDKQEYDQAIADYTEAIRLKPTDAIAFYNRGQAYKAKGDTDRAAQDFASAEKLQAEGRGARNDP
jgi:tetratricopeptide (TPR) repeat protein